MPGPSADGAGGWHGVGRGWGDINIHIDITMNIDIHIIINMNIKYYIHYYTLLMSNLQEKSKITKTNYESDNWHRSVMSWPFRIQPNIPNLIIIQTKTNKSKLVPNANIGRNWSKKLICFDNVYMYIQDFTKKIMPWGDRRRVHICIRNCCSCKRSCS